MEQHLANSRPPRMKRNRDWISPFLICLAILACNLPTSAPPSLATATLPAVQETIIPVVSTPTPTIVYQPVFEAAVCAFPVPSGYSPDCGYLVIPENRTRADSPLIRLHVAIFRNRAGIPVADPVVHLAGGPG